MTDEQVSEPAEEVKALMVLQKTLGLMRGQVYSVAAGQMPPAPIVIQSPSDELLERLAQALEGGNTSLTKALKERDKQMFKEQAEMLALAVETILDKQADQASAFAGMSAAIVDGIRSVVSTIRQIPAPPAPVVHVASPTIHVAPSKAEVSVKMPVVTEEEASVVERDYAGKVMRIRRKRTYS